MELKRRKSKVSYTVMIISDSAKKHIKKVHLRAGMAGVLTTLAFTAVVLLVCYVIYSSITLSDSLERSKKQSGQIVQLKEENEKLQAENDSLTGKVSILSETINQKVEAEQALAAEQEEMHLPKGFPLSGSAQIKTEEAGDGEEEEQEEITEHEDKKELIFTAGAGISVIASGAGTVTAAGADTEFGNMVSIDHGNGYTTTYRNGANPMVKAGDEVTRGAILFVIGEENTDMGYSIQKDNVSMDPMEMIEING